MSDDLKKHEMTAKEDEDPPVIEKGEDNSSPPTPVGVFLTRKKALLLVFAVVSVCILVGVLTWFFVDEYDDDSSDEGSDSADEAFDKLPATPFEEIKFFFEDNTSDEDLGVQLKLGADPWTELSIKFPDGSEMLNVKTNNVLKIHGMSDLFFESAEPNFEEVPKDVILSRFPEGIYEFEAKTLDGGRLLSQVPLSHDIPAGPVITSPETTLNDDGEMIGKVPHDDVFIEWEGVTGIPIQTYEVIVTNEEDTRFISDVYYGADTRNATVFKAFFQPGVTYELEVLARAKNHNQAISIIFFDIEEAEDDE